MVRNAYVGPKTIQAPLPFPSFCSRALYGSFALRRPLGRPKDNGIEYGNYVQLTGSSIGSSYFDADEIFPRMDSTPPPPLISRRHPPLATLAYFSTVHMRRSALLENDKSFMEPRQRKLMGEIYRGAPELNQLEIGMFTSAAHIWAPKLRKASASKVRVFYCFSGIQQRRVLEVVKD